jgi:hypothetical protein
MNQIKKGVYRHYKNKYYQVVGVGRDTDKLEKYVIYKSLYYDPVYGQATWLRKEKEFNETIHDSETGKHVKRFEFVGDDIEKD